MKKREEKERDSKLERLLKQYEKSESLIDTVFLLCETQEERQRMFDFIETKKPTRGKICEYAAVIDIEAGRGEGELEDCDDDYWN